MTFTQLQEKLGTQNQTDWSQHENGKGWIFKTAKVDKSAYIEGIIFGLSQVSGDAWVYGNARVSGNAQVYGNARVSGDAWVYGDARVSGNAQVYGNARVSGNAQVYGNARVSGDAWVYGDAWEKSPLFILGSRHSLTNAKKGHIQIGCKCATYDWWKKHGESFGRENGYTASDIHEYQAYIALFTMVGK